MNEKVPLSTFTLNWARSLNIHLSYGLTLKSTHLNPNSILITIRSPLEMSIRKESANATIPKKKLISQTLFL